MSSVEETGVSKIISTHVSTEWGGDEREFVRFLSVGVLCFSFALSICFGVGGGGVMDTEERDPAKTTTTTTEA